MRKSLYWLAWIAWFVLLALGFLAVGEIGFRAFGPEPSYEETFSEIWKYKPYVVYTEVPNKVLKRGDKVGERRFAHPKITEDCVEEDSIIAKFNSSGFRCEEFSGLNPKEPSEYRIIIVGGSAALSARNSEKCTFDKKLKKALSLRFPNLKFRVFVLAAGGWISIQEIIAFQLWGIELQPDLVIAFDGSNDILHSMGMPINDPYEAGAIDITIRRHHKWVTGGISDLAQQLRLISFLRNWISPPPIETEVRSTSPFPISASNPGPGRVYTQPECFPVDLEAVSKRTDFDPYNRQVVDNYLKNMRLLAETAEISGTKLLCTLQPNFYLKKVVGPWENKVLQKAIERLNYVAQGYVRMEAGIREIAREKDNVFFCDLSRIFSEIETDIFVDHVHFMPQGYDIIVSELVDVIVEFISSDSQLSLLIKS